MQTISLVILTERGMNMEIHSDSYRIAPLSGQEDVVEVIRQAESEIARMTGNPEVTLIAYEKTDGHRSK